MVTSRDRRVSGDADLIAAYERVTDAMSAWSLLHEQELVKVERQEWFTANIIREQKANLALRIAHEIVDKPAITA